MKRKITFLIAAAFMLLTLLVSPMAMRGQSDYSTDYEGNIELSTTGGSNASTCTVIISDNSYAGIKAGTSSNVGAMMITVPSGTKYLHMHVAAWKNNTVSLAVTPEGYSDNIELTANTGISNNSPFTFDGDPSTSDYYKVVTFSDALTADTELTFTAVGGKRFVIWGVTSEEEGSSSDPSITANNVEIDYNVTSGAIAYTINNPVAGGSISAATTADWLTPGTAGNVSIPFTCSANQAMAVRTALVTLTYTYNNNQTVTKNVLVSQAGNPNVVNNISDITAAGTYTVQGTIVAISNRGFILGDGTGYVYYYYGSSGFEPGDYSIGDIVKLAGQVVVYGGVFEFNSNTTITTATSSGYVAEDPTILTGEDMAARVASTTPPQLSSYVQYVGTLSVSGTYYNITNIDGAGEAQGSISFPLNTDFTSLNGKQVTVTGYYVGISSSKYYNTMIGSIEEITNPYIAAEDVDIAYNATSGSIVYTINNPVSGGQLTAATDSDWLNLGTVGNTIPFTCTANNSASSRSATVTLTYTYNTNQTVTQDVMVVQAGNPNMTNSISDITEVGTSYTVVGTVVAVNNKGFAIGDGTGYVYTYLNSTPTYEVGDIVKISGTTGSYGHIIQFTDSATIEAATVSGYDGTPEVTVITEVPDYSDDYYLSTYLQYQGLLVHQGNNYRIQVGSGTSASDYIQISYPNTAQTESLVSLQGKTVRVKGYFAGINSNNYFTTMMESIEEAFLPTITIQARVDVPAAENEGTLEVTYQEVDPSAGLTIQWYTIIGTQVEGFDWITASFDSDYNLVYHVDANLEPAARTACFMIVGQDAESNIIRSNRVDLVQAKYIEPIDPVTYTLATTIESGKQYIIVGSKTINDETSYYALGEQKTSNRAGAAITVDGNTATVEFADVYEVVITALDEEGFYSIYDARNDGYLYASGATANQLKTETELDVNGEWAISIDEEGLFSVVAANSENRNVMQFNYNNGNPLFNCYSDATQLPVALYVREETTTTQTIALEANNVLWTSFYVDITLDDLKAAIAAVLSNTDEATIKSQLQTLTYKRGRWTGQLTELDKTQMYLIKVSSSCEITLEGAPVDATTLTTTITPGVNYIAYPYETSTTPTAFFAGFAIDQDVIKSQTQSSKYNRNRWVGQVNALEAGNGYIFNSAGTSERTFVYPTLKKSGK